MKLSCMLGKHKWYDGKCRVCGKPYDSYGPLDQLEGKITRSGSLVDRAMIIQSLPQEALVYLAEHAANFSVVDMALPKIRDEDKVAEIGLKRGNRDIAYSAVNISAKPDNIAKFIDHPDLTVRKFAQQKLEAAKLSTREEIEDYLDKNRYGRIEPWVEQFLKNRLREM